MLETHLRQAAVVLLESAIRIAPPDTREWGRAMQAELSHVQGPWAAVGWALGGASVLAKHALASFLIPGRRRPAIPPHGGLFAREGPMRRITTLLSSIAVAAFLLLLFAPSFRQGMEVSLGTWQAGFDDGASYDRALRRLGAQARRQQDAEAMAFVALRLRRDPESSRLAEEAVRLNSQWTWVYSIFGNPYHSSADAEEMIRKLEAWDPQNALPYLIEAERISFRHYKESNHHSLGFAAVKDDARWFEAMSAAFRAEKYDSYLTRRLDMDRDVMRRLHLHDPLLLISAGSIPYGIGSSVQIYASYLLNSARDLEAKGDLNQASKIYSTVARFCQMVQTDGHTDFERMAVVTPQLESYRRLKTLAGKAGNLPESDLLSYEIRQLEQQKQGMGKTGESAYGYRWVALMVQASSLVVVLSAGLLLVWAASKAGHRFMAPSEASPWRSVFSSAGTVGAFGLLFGALTLYVSFQPYAEVFKDFMASTGAGQFRSLISVFFTLFILRGSVRHLWYSDVLGLYFWSAFIVFATAILIFVFIRKFRKDLRFHAAR